MIDNNCRINVTLKNHSYKYNNASDVYWYDLYGTTAIIAASEQEQEPDPEDDHDDNGIATIVAEARAAPAVATETTTDHHQ